MITLKTLTIGKSRVGKSILVLNLTDDTSDPEPVATIDVDLKFTTWETAGHERFRTLTPGYYSGTQGVILVYDITKKDTFVKVGSWIHEMILLTCRLGIKLIKKFG